MKRKTPFQRDLKRKHCFLVSISRRETGCADVFGFVVDASDALVLLHFFDSTAFCLTGYEVIRHQDIDSYCFFDDPRYWRVRAMRKVNIKPVKPKGIILSSMRDCLASVAKRYPLLSVRRERRRGTTVEFAGPIVSLAGQTFRIEDSNYFGEWTGKRRLKYEEVTSVTFDDGYLRASAMTVAKLSEKPNLG